MVTEQQEERIAAHELPRAVDGMPVSLGGLLEHIFDPLRQPRQLLGFLQRPRLAAKQRPLFLGQTPEMPPELIDVLL